MTSRTPNQAFRPADLLDVSPTDASRLQLAEGDVVRIVSRYGSATLRVHISSRVSCGQLFATFHTAATFVNTVTGPHRDRVTATPQYKRTAVRIDRDHGKCRTSAESFRGE